MASSSSPLEKLPAEVGAMILRAMPDTKSLFALIAASPLMLHLYCRARDQTFISAIRNEIGESLIRHATFLVQDDDFPHSLEDFTGVGCETSITDAKSLLREVGLTRSIIQNCIEDELEDSKVELTDTEWMRLRRGMYNFRVAAKLSACSDADMYQDIQPFLQHCTTTEILEMLYILHCLRNRYTKHLSSLDDAMLEDVLYHAFRADFWEDHSFFSKIDRQGRLRWISDGPWTHYIDTIYEECQVPARWHREYEQDPCYQSSADPVAVLDSITLTSHDFEDLEGNGFRWLKQSENTGSGYNYHRAIPLGFMIWDDKRLEGMSWMRQPPPLKPIEARWQTSLQTYQSVEERSEAAEESSRKTGEKLYTWYDEYRKQKALEELREPK